MKDLGVDIQASPTAHGQTLGASIRCYGCQDQVPASERAAALSERKRLCLSLGASLAQVEPEWSTATVIKPPETQGRRHLFQGHCEVVGSAARPAAAPGFAHAPMCPCGCRKLHREMEPELPRLAACKNLPDSVIAPRERLQCLDDADGVRRLGSSALVPCIPHCGLGLLEPRTLSCQSHFPKSTSLTPRMLDCVCMVV